MKTIWKYAVPFPDGEIEMPQGGRILAVETQNSGAPYLWVEVDTTEPLIVRRFFVAGTGHALRPGKYVGTFQQAGCALVWHVYEEVQ